MAGRRGYGTGGLIERSPGHWQITVELGRDPETGKRRRHRFTVHGTRGDAQRALTKAMAARDRGVDPSPPQLSIGEYLDRWLDEHASLTVAPSTLDGYRKIVRRLKRLLGDGPLSDLTSERIAGAYAGLLADGLSGQTVLNHHHVLRPALARAVRRGLMKHNLAEDVATPRAEHREMRTLSAREVDLVANAAPDDEFRCLIRVAVTTGLRLGELLGLKWADIDFDGGRAGIRRAAKYHDRQTTLGPLKTRGSRRSVALSRHTLAVLHEQRVHQTTHRLEVGPAYASLDLVFPAADGSAQPPYRISGRFRATVARAGLEGVRFHDLRHTMATLALNQGVHVKVVSERLGHSTTQVTLDTYSHVLPDLQRDAAELLDDALGVRQAS